MYTSKFRNLVAVSVILVLSYLFISPAIETREGAIYLSGAIYLLSFSVSWLWSKWTPSRSRIRFLPIIVMGILACFEFLLAVDRSDASDRSGVINHLMPLLFWMGAITLASIVLFGGEAKKSVTTNKPLSESL